MSEVFINKLLDMEAQITALKAKVAAQDKAITGMKHYLKVAADYQNEDPEQVMAAIQAALGKAAAYQKMPKFKGRKSV